MICRREWLKQGAAVVIGGATLVVGEPIEAERQDAPLKIEMQGIFFTMAGEFGGTYGTKHVSVAVSFDEDGSFCLTPRTRNEDGRRELGRSVIGADHATARDLIDLLLALPGMDA
jgi:hypothetical protein